MDNFVVSKSPYSQDFESFLDPAIKQLVLSLVDKGYMPCYSCEGHKLYKPRYVIVGFGSGEARETFSNLIIKKWERTLFSIERLDSLTIEKIEGQSFTHQTAEEEIRGFNQLFIRNYERYCFLKINIGLTIYIYNDEMGSFREELKLKTKKLFVGCFNFIVRGILTALLTSRIQRLRPVLP